MDKRVVVTGYGCLTGVGMTAEETWASVESGRSGIERMPSADPASLYPLAADIVDYDARALTPDRKLLKVIGRSDVLGLNAVTQALTHSGVLEHRTTVEDPETFNDRTGIFVGAPASEYRQRYDFLPALAEADGNLATFGSRAMGQVHPLWLLRTLPNNVLAYTGIHFGFKGANHNFTDHGVSGSQAIAEAARHLLEGCIDRAVVVGFDSPAEPEAVAYYGSVGLLSSTGLKPFEATHDGTVFGEGAGAIVLETLVAATSRGATIHGEILGSGITSEAHGILGVRDDGDGLRRAMLRSLEDAGLPPSAIGMVAAHGNGTPASDVSEARALGRVFGADPVPTSGFKWSLGHTLAAAGVIESILTLICLREHVVPGMPTLREQAHACLEADVSASARAPRSDTGMVLTRGFSGLNSCVVLAGPPS